MRLNRFLAAAGIASRREADELIVQGRVTVNGRRCTDFHYQPEPGDYVKVDGKLISPKTRVHLVLNKPRGFVCTQRDPHASDTIFDLLPPKFSRLFYVGRLDAQSEGLLLLTNDSVFRPNAFGEFGLPISLCTTCHQEGGENLALTRCVAW